MLLGKPARPPCPFVASEWTLTTRVCRNHDAIGSFLSSRTCEHCHSSEILYSNKTTLAYTVQNSYSPSSKICHPSQVQSSLPLRLQPNRACLGSSSSQMKAHINCRWIGDYPGRNCWRKFFLSVARKFLPSLSSSGSRSMPDRVQAVTEAKGGALATNFLGMTLCRSFFLLSVYI